MVWKIIPILALLFQSLYLARLIWIRNRIIRGTTNAILLSVDDSNIDVPEFSLYIYNDQTGRL